MAQWVVSLRRYIKSVMLSGSVALGYIGKRRNRRGRSGNPFLVSPWRATDSPKWDGGSAMFGWLNGHGLSSGRGPGQDFPLDPGPYLLAGDLQIVRDLEIQPVLRRRSEIPGQAHRGIHGDGPLTVDDGADPVHGNAKGPRAAW
ncbi:hypothetical protein SBA4_3250002 [Candidatus Sulfopaludibacter sp. SbA4]|nr:hypothetical protein SBA4_3250002 [Candidatus Sulfopaludibacter sp. SbA4]